MHYSFATDNDYIVGVIESEDRFPNEITKEERDKIYGLLLNRPSAPDGFIYKLRADTLEWELVELPEPSDESDDEATESDYIEALQDLGVDVE